VKRLALVAIVLSACGSAKTYSAADVRACVGRGAYTHVFVSREEGVTSLNYAYANGGEADVSVFRSAKDAAEAEKQEARLGDAHDRLRANVLFSGGGRVQAALERCLR
jgi:hypothetical protein